MLDLKILAYTINEMSNALPPRFHSTVALAEIWKNTYKTKLID